ncbi:MAG: hypothetical protein AAF962_16845 [Actinomycetota bacterium]
MSSWPRGRSADGGIDEIPLPGAGRLWLCGKHAVGPDPDGALSRVGADTLLCFNERHEIEARYPDYVSWLRADAPGRLWFPTPDLGVRPVEEFLPLVEDCVARLDDGARLLAHCGAGIGRAGTFAVAVLSARGVALDQALATVADHRPSAGPEAGSQEELAATVAEHFGPSRP